MWQRRLVLHSLFLWLRPRPAPERRLYCFRPVGRSMSWLALALVSAFCLASADAAGKALLRDYRPGELVLVRLGLTGVLFLPLVLYQGWPTVPGEFWAWVGAAIPLELLAMLAYMRSVQTSPLSHSVPYMAFTPVFTVLTGYLLLGERVSPPGLLGILLVTAGAWLLRARRGSSALLPLRALLFEPGPRWMLLAAFVYSLTSVLGKGALQYLPPGRFGPLYFLVLGVATLLVFGLARPRRLSRLLRRPAPVAVIAVLMAAMAITHFFAVAQVEVAYFIAAKRSSLLFGILYGALLFSERRLGWHLLAGAVMVVGVVLLNL